MKKIISADIEDEIIVECECHCGFITVHKYKAKPKYQQLSDSYNIRYYSSSNLKKRDKFAWDICIDERQFNAFLEALNKLKEE